MFASTYSSGFGGVGSRRSCARVAPGAMTSRSAAIGTSIRIRRLYPRSGIAALHAEALPRSSGRRSPENQEAPHVSIRRFVSFAGSAPLLAAMVFSSVAAAQEAAAPAKAHSAVAPVPRDGEKWWVDRQ